MTRLVCDLFGDTIKKKMKRINCGLLMWFPFGKTRQEVKKCKPTKLI